MNPFRRRSMTLEERERRWAQILSENEEWLGPSATRTIERDGKLVQVRSLDRLREKFRGAPIDADATDPRNGR